MDTDLIDLIVTAVVDNHLLTTNDGTADKLGRNLLQENVTSVLSRYSDGVDADEYTGYAMDIEHYRFRHTGQLPVVQVLKAVDCYEYQSCEHDGWQGSHARNVCGDLRRELVTDLPGYSDAAWAWERGL